MEIFRQRAYDLYNDKYDYSQVNETHIKGIGSKVPVICNICSYSWEPTIRDHINGKRGCPQCAANIKWTKDKFILRAVQLNGNKFDYSNITDDQIQCKDAAALAA